MDKFSELKAAAMAATPQKIDGAQEKTEDGCMECPCCSGDGQVDVGADYCNYDNTAIGVIFYGIGDAHVAAERYFRAANPTAILALLAELEAKDKRIAELEAKTAMTMGVGSGNGNLFVHGDYDSIKAAQAIVLENESLRAKLATPVRLTDERTLWAGEDDYDTGHVKGWNANRIEQAALLKKQGFTVEGDE